MSAPTAGRRDRRAGGPRQREPAPLPPGRDRARRARARRRLPVARCARPIRRSTAPTACRTAGWTTRSCSWPSAPTAPSPSSATAPRWGRACAPGMPMIVADELEADWKRVRVVQATGDEKRFGNQDTDGSRSTRHFFEPMRRCGAAARTMLEAAAAARWGVPVDEVAGEEPRGRARQDGPARGLRLARQGRGQPARAGAGHACASRIRRSSATSARAS